MSDDMNHLEETIAKINMDQDRENTTPPWIGDREFRLEAVGSELWAATEDGRRLVAQFYGGGAADLADFMARTYTRIQYFNVKFHKSAGDRREGNRMSLPEPYHEWPGYGVLYCGMDEK